MASGLETMSAGATPVGDGPGIMPVLVITRPGSTRHAEIAAHLGSLGLAHEVSPAIFPVGEFPWSPSNDAPTRLRNLGYPLSKGEVGCFLAHRMAWATALARGWPVTLIMEDDARLSEVGDTLRSCAMAVVGRSCYLRLCHGENRAGQDVWRELADGKRSIVYPRRPGVSTVAYIVTAEGAAALLRSSETFWCAVDEFMNLEHIHSVTGFHLHPPMATHEDGGASLIGCRRKPSVGPMARIRREVLRACRNLRLAATREATRWRLGIRPGGPFRTGRATHGT